MGDSVVARFEVVVARIRSGACIPERTNLMNELVSLLHQPECPATLRAKGLELIGRLARREVCEPACKSGLNDMQARVRARNTG